ncbi:hypothetical protein P7D22_20385 [Lichenihabitans sp. Uapishka_5]|uniref:hypothetical protein n=1 Tax=Lichenihabitans sp. Uapishka_5 TaxID=3037302 RepID=UPI0029E7D0CB|nr:hypothetical protein [Lichenihabitans sp. Uapishka_5]MDX7953527.1 hypothetical protein [Lichenihabitans sp. Uapishka_5]
MDLYRLQTCEQDGEHRLTQILREDTFQSPSDNAAIKDAKQFLTAHAPPEGAIVILRGRDGRRIWSPAANQPSYTNDRAPE